MGERNLMADEDDHKRTIQYGESAISYIKKNVLPAYPRSYELWYTYAAGYNQGLNRAVNESIKSNGRISTDEMLTLYGRFLSPTRLGDRLDEVGSKVSREVEELVDTLKLSADATSDYGTALEQAGEKIRSVSDPEKLQNYVTHLVKSTQNAVASNRKLESQLLESKKHIENLQSSLEAIRYESLTDELTTLNNRKHFENSIERVIDQSKESGRGFSLLMTDIDHFKKLTTPMATRLATRFCDLSHLRLNRTSRHRTSPAGMAVRNLRSFCHMSGSKMLPKLARTSEMR